MSEENPTNPPSAPAKKPFLSSDARNVAYNIVEKCLDEQKTGVSDTAKPYIRALSYTGLSIKYLSEIDVEDGEAEETRKPGYDNALRETGKFDVDYYDRHTVHRFIEHFFISSPDNECTGVNFIKQFRETLYFPWGLPHLKRLLKEMGYCKRQVGGKIIQYGLERLNIFEARKKYLKEIQKYRQCGRNIFYIDEMWIDRGRFRKYWRVEAEDAILTDVEAKDWLILIHAGSRNGFLDEAKWLFEVGETQNELQVQMGKENFELWVKTLLIPNLPPNCVVVMDSASYHNERTSPETPDEVSLYKIDGILKENGHTVCRIPTYMNPEFNPLLLAWEKIAGLIDKDIAEAMEHGVHVNVNIMRLITLKAISKVKAGDWKQFESRVQFMEDMYRLKDKEMEEMIEKKGENFHIFEDILSSDSDSD